MNRTSKGHFPPEVALLLACSRTSCDAAQEERIRQLIRQDLNWSYLTRLAIRHTVVSLIYSQLRSYCEQGVPDQTLKLLEKWFLTMNWSNLAKTGELLAILDLFATHKITVVPFKGPVLAAAVYGNLALRYFNDLDILIHKRDIPSAKNLLIAHGYRPQIELSKEQEEIYLREHYVISLVREDNSLVVELHYGIRPKYFAFALAPEYLWQHVQSITLGGKQVHTFSPEDLLLILCAHGANHCWERLSWICDIAELLRTSTELDWEQVVMQSRRLGSKRILDLGLFMANDLLQATIPDPILQEIHADPTVKQLARWVYEQLFSDQYKQLSNFGRSRFHLRVRERKRDQMLYCLRLLTVPNEDDWLFQPLPASLSFLHYLIRPFRLFRKFCGMSHGFLLFLRW